MGGSLRARLVGPIVAGAVACGSATNLDVTGAVDRDAAPLACHWPSTLISFPHHSPGKCTAAHAVVSCIRGGITAICLGNDVRCEEFPSDCHDLCKPTEYGALCGSFMGAGPADDAPPGCLTAAITFAGYTYYCCPCN